MSARRSLGFTLIEVMIAVVILAVGLSSLFTSEAGAVKIAQRARATTIATLLARCKMGEVEEKVQKEGWPSDSIDGRDECCEDAEQDGFTCEWKVERITLPETNVEDGPQLTGDKQTVGAAKEAAGSLLGKDGPAAAAGAKSEGPLAALSTDGGLGEILAGSTGSREPGESDPMAALAMELALPVMKPVIEEGVRRATVTVQWKEGSREQTFDVVQYLVNELPMMPDENLTEQLTGAGAGDAGAQPQTGRDGG